MSEEKQLCGGCGRGCTIDALSCDHGRALHGQPLKGDGQGGHQGHMETKGSHEHSGMNFGEIKTVDDKINHGIRMLGHMLHHGEGRLDLSKLSEEEKNTLAELLLKLAPTNHSKE